MPDTPRDREFDADEGRALLAMGRRNMWIRSDQITTAEIIIGRSTSRVSFRMKDGDRIKLLWLRCDRADEPLREALMSWEIEVKG